MKWIKVEMKFSHHYTLKMTLSSYNQTEKADLFLREWWPDFEKYLKNYSANRRYSAISEHVHTIS